MKKTLLCALTLITSSTALAQPDTGFYTGAAISRWQYSELTSDPGLRLDTRLEALEINGGFWFHPLLSAELRLGTGLGDRTVTVGNSVIETNMNYYSSLYWRPEWANEAAKLYALLGYSAVDLTAQQPGGSNGVDISESGPSFGLGVGFTYAPDIMVNLEWKQLVDTDGFEMLGFTAGFDYRF